MKKKWIKLGTIISIAAPSAMAISCIEKTNIKDSSHNQEISNWWSQLSDMFREGASSSITLTFSRDDYLRKENKNREIKREVTKRRIYTPDMFANKFNLSNKVFPDVKTSWGISPSFQIHLPKLFNASSKIANLIAQNNNNILGWRFLQQEGAPKSSKTIVFCNGGPSSERPTNYEISSINSKFAKFGNMILFNEAQYGFIPSQLIYNEGPTSSNKFIASLSGQTKQQEMFEKLKNHSLETYDILRIITEDTTLNRIELNAAYAMASSIIDANRQHDISVELKRMNDLTSDGIFLMGHSYGYKSALNSILYNNNFSTDYKKIVLEANSLWEYNPTIYDNQNKSGGYLYQLSPYNNPTGGDTLNLNIPTRVGNQAISSDGKYNYIYGAFYGIPHIPGNTPISRSPQTQPDEVRTSGQVSNDLVNMMQTIWETWGAHNLLSSMFSADQSYLTKVQNTVIFRPHRRDLQIGEIFAEEAAFLDSNHLNWNYSSVGTAKELEQLKYNGHSKFSNDSVYSIIFR